MALTAFVVVHSLQDFKVFLSFTKASASGLLFLKLSDEVFRKPGDSVKSFTLASDRSFMSGEGGQDLTSSPGGLNLVLTTNPAGLSSGKVQLHSGGKGLLDVDNELRLSSLGLQLLNQTPLVEHSEGLLKPRLDLPGDGFLLARGLDLIVVLQFFKDLVVGHKPGALQLDPAGGVTLGLDAHLGGEPDTGVLVTVLLGVGPAIGLDSTGGYTADDKKG